jgi:ribosomal protein L27
MAAEVHHRRSILIRQRGTKSSADITSHRRDWTLFALVTVGLRQEQLAA